MSYIMVLMEEKSFDRRSLHAGNTFRFVPAPVVAFKNTVHYSFVQPVPQKSIAKSIWA